MPAKKKVMSVKKTKSLVKKYREAYPDIAKAAMEFSAPSYSGIPWPKNKQSLNAMLDDAKSRGYYKGAADKERELNHKHEHEREMLKIKRDLMSAYGQTLGPLADAISQASFILNNNR